MVGLPCSSIGLPDLKTANGSSLRISKCVMVPIKLPNSTRDIHHKVLLVDGLQVPCILGMDFMKKARIIIDTQAGKIKMEPPLPGSFKHNPARLLKVKQEVTIKPQEEMLVIGECDINFATALVSSNNNPLVHLMDGVVDGSNTKECSLLLLNPSLDAVQVPKGTIVGYMSPLDRSDFAPIEQVLQVSHSQAWPQLSDISYLANIKLNHIPVQHREKYANLIRSYSDIFSKHDLDVGHSSTLPHTVRLLNPNKIVSINQYRLPYHLKEVAIDYVDKKLKSGVIRPSTSVFNSPLMLVKKPNADPSKPLGEQYRLVHNYIELNKLIAPCSYPLRHLYELLDEVASGKVFSVLDLSQEFFQQTLIDPQETTSFSIPGYGQFTYNRSPQGLNSSPAYFQRLLDFVLKQIDRCYVYIDDVVISAHSHEQSLVTLEKVFRRFRLHNLKIKPSKCHIGTGSISYLGYEITAGKGIQPGLAKTETVRSFPEPCTVKEIRAFIGLTSFFRRAIKDYSLISGPLNKLVRKDNGYTSGKLPLEASKSFLSLKNALINRSCLAPVNFNVTFIVTTDASETHYASCLSQKGSDGVERPCGYSNSY